MGHLSEGDPARYHITPTEKGIAVAVNKQTLPNFEITTQERMDEIARYQGIPSFIKPSSEHEWGFGPVFKETQSPNPEWVIYSADYPHIFKKDRFSADKAIALSQSLSTLFTFVGFSENTSSSPVEQQMDVDLGIDRSATFHGAPIGAEVYESLVKWMRANLDDDTAIQIRKSMQRGYQNMWNDHDFTPDFSDFRLFWNQPKWLFLAVPGDAADLGPHMYHIFDESENETGYRMGPHNIDGPHQQLSLLSGLAKLDELATNGYYKIDPNKSS